MDANGDRDDADSLRRYLEEAARQPPLTRDEEHRLAREAAAGNAEARDVLVLSNLRLVVALAKRYRATGVPFIDLIQEGNLGLVRAVDQYDPDRGFAFSTFATWWIRQSLARLARDETSHPALAAVQEAWDRHVRDHGRQPSLGELATATGMAEGDLLDLLGRPPA